MDNPSGITGNGDHDFTGGNEALLSFVFYGYSSIVPEHVGSSNSFLDHFNHLSVEVPFLLNKNI